MSLLQLAYVVALRRIISHWRLELVLFLGIALAVALMSSGVVFSDLLAETALRRAMEQATEEEANFSIWTSNKLDDPSYVSREASAYQGSVDLVEQRVAEPFKPYLRDHARLFETSTFFFAGHSQLELENNVRPRGRLNYMTGLFPERVTVVEGRWPYAGTGSGLGIRSGPIEIAIDEEGAGFLQLGVDDEMEVFPATREVDQPSINVKIVGIFSRVDLADEFWYAASFTFSSPDNPYSQVPLFTSEDAIAERLGQVYPGLHNEVTWFFYLDRTAIRAGDVGRIHDTIERVKFEVGAYLEQSRTNIRLGGVLDDYEEQLLLARIPLFLMLFLVTGILVYYLALMTGLIVKSRATEISMLKSRGSTTFQLGLLALVEGLLLAVPALAVGPFLALGVSRALGRIFFDVGGDAGLPAVAISSHAFLLGLAGALLAVVVFTVATLAAARHGIVEFRRAGARPSQAPFIHRYYLDILVLVLIGFLWWQIQSRGTFLVRPLGTGDLEIDYSLLLGPVLGLLALGLLMLRFFPIALALVAKLAEPVGPAWLVHSLRRVRRDPIIPGMLVVLLMLATALGVIGSAFSSTLERSQEDRARYAAGADLRIEHQGGQTLGPLQRPSDLEEEVDGVVGAAQVNRSIGNLLPGGFRSTTVSVLAVDTASFADVGWYRPDFAGGNSLKVLTKALTPDPSAPSPVDDGIRLPQEARALALWAHADRPVQQASLRARLQDDRGYYFDVFLGSLNFRGWRRLEAELSPIPPQGRRGRDQSQLPVATPPYTLLSIQVSNPAFSGFTEPGVVFVEDLVALTPEGENVLASFRSLDGWHVVENYMVPGLYALETSESVSHTANGRSAAFSWAPARTGGMRGFRAGGPELPLPAVLSKSALDTTEANVGDTLTMSTSNVVLQLKVVAEAEYFPTLNPRDRPFVVVDLDTFNHYVNLHSRRTAGGNNELWVSLDEPTESPTAVIEALQGLGMNVRETHLASAMVSQRVEQPLVNAGWGGLLVLMFLAMVLASASGAMLFSYMDTRERQMDFALLRTLGFSKRQLNGVVWFNLILVVVCGIGLGTWAGQQIGSSLLPVLEVAEEGVRVTPPMVLQTNWVSLLVSYLVLATVTAVTVVWLAWLAAKLDIQQVLRMDQA